MKEWLTRVKARLGLAGYWSVLLLVIIAIFYFASRFAVYPDAYNDGAVDGYHAGSDEGFIAGVELVSEYVEQRYGIHLTKDFDDCFEDAMKEYGYHYPVYEWNYRKYGRIWP